MRTRVVVNILETWFDNTEMNALSLVSYCFGFIRFLFELPWEIVLSLI